MTEQQKQAKAHNVQVSDSYMHRVNEKLSHEPAHKQTSESVEGKERWAKSQQIDTQDHDLHESDSTDASGWSLFDSKATQVDDELIEKFQQVFHNATSQVLLHEVSKIATEYDPIDLAHAINRLPVSVRHVVYKHLPDLKAKISFMVHITSTSRVAIFRHISDEELAKLVDRIPADEAVSVLEDLPGRRLKRVLELLDPQKALRIHELQKHGRDTAGRLMTNEFFAFNLNTTLGQVAQTIRENPGIELTRSIFVLNDDSELIGYVPERNMIINPPSTALRKVMRPVIHTIEPDASRDEVVDLVERYRIPELPVVVNDKLVGVINYADVVEVMEDIADETMAIIGGTAEDVSEYESVMTRFFARAPWLIVTVCAGLITATGLSHFQGNSWFMIVPFFVPLITGMSGNVGIQCSTILVRGMATGKISFGSRWEVVFRELRIGLMIGAIFGVLCGLIVFWLNHFGIYNVHESPRLIGLVVFSGMLGACVTASVLGTLSPLFFARCRIDPAIASGPIVTAFNDVLSTFMFCLVTYCVSSLIYV